MNDQILASMEESESEAAMRALCSLYRSYGYGKYKVSKFEEYDFYAKNKSFLLSEHILTFTDTNGKLMALKPDITLSIIKNVGEDDLSLHKCYYNETVYRTGGRGEGFREIRQTGLECIGTIDLRQMCEVIRLAEKSLALLGTRYVLGLSHMSFLLGLFETAGVRESDKEELLGLIGEKNTAAVTAFADKHALKTQSKEALLLVTTLYESPETALPRLLPYVNGEKMQAAYEELCALWNLLRDADRTGTICLDFSVKSDMQYYNGIIFRGFVDGIPEGILSGGRYDHLLSRMGKQAQAIGFAVYPDLLFYRNAHSDAPKAEAETQKITINIALPKGRLGEKAYDIFDRAGYPCPSILKESRKLIFENETSDCIVRYFWVKPSDVAIYVERGAADVGIAGKDILLEYAPDLYELADLEMGKCRMAVAAKKDFCDDRERPLRVATKFPNIAKAHYARLSREIDVIKLNGSIELAPILGLSDVIVDIVETGKTLYENNLEPKEDIVPISARLVANKSSYQFKYEAIRRICDEIKKTKKG